MEGRRLSTQGRGSKLQGDALGLTELSGLVGQSYEPGRAGMTKEVVSRQAVCPVRPIRPGSFGNTAGGRRPRRNRYRPSTRRYIVNFVKYGLTALNIRFYCVNLIMHFSGGGVRYRFGYI
jgi:hypothetical protein